MSDAPKKLLLLTRNFHKRTKQMMPTFLSRLLNKAQKRDVIVVSCDDARYAEQFDLPVRHVSGFFNRRTEVEISRLYTNLWEGRLRLSQARAILQRHFSLLGVTMEIIPLLHQVRIIHWFEIFSPLASLLRLLSRSYGIKNYITLASLTPNFHLYNPLLRASLCYFDKVVVTTLALKKFLERIGFPSTKIRQIPLGVDLATFKPRPEDKVKMKLSEGIDPGRRVITWFGPISPTKFKDFHQLLRIACAIEKSLPCSFIFAFKYETPLSIDRSLIGYNTRFVVSRRVHDVLTISDLLVVPFTSTKSILSSLTIIESLSAGVPVITTKLPGLDEIVSNNINGILVNRIDEIPGVIAELLTQENRLAAMSYFARKIAEEKFDINKTAKSYVDLWEG